LFTETDKGCVSANYDSTITVSSTPVAKFSLPENCVNDPVSLFLDSSSVANGLISDWLWNFGDPNATPTNPNTSAAQNGSHHYVQARDYDVTLTATSDKGCVGVATKTFTINGSVPQSNFSVVGGTTACVNKSISIMTNPGVDVGRIIKLEVFWDDANDQSNKIVDDEPSAGKQYTVNYPSFSSPVSKIYTIRVRAYSGERCFDDSVIAITVNATPEIQFTAPLAVCSDSAAFQLNASVGNVAGTGVYSGRGVSASGMFNPAQAGFGQHTIKYTFTSATGCLEVREQTIKVNAIPFVDAGPSVPLGVLEGGSVTFPSTATGSGLKYLWTPSVWLSNPNLLQPIASPLRDTVYTLTVINADGCKAADQVQVRVLKGITIPNVFTPNGDGINDSWEITYLESYRDAVIQLYNRYGQLIFQSKGYNKPWDGTVNGKPVPFGTYYYVIDPKNGRKAITGFVDIIR
jgi:gliding motility-associated-like protein